MVDHRTKNMFNAINLSLRWERNDVHGGGWNIAFRQRCRFGVRNARRYAIEIRNVSDRVWPYVLIVWKILKYEHEKSATDYAVSRK